MTMMYSVGTIYGLDEVIEYVELEYNGYQVLACKVPDGYRLERIYSTNPKDFLKTDLQPGKILENALIK